MEIKLAVPVPEHEEKALEFKQEFFDNGKTVINGSELYHFIETKESTHDRCDQLEKVACGNIVI